MASYTYTYIGKEIVHVPVYGLVKPNEVITASQPINHPLFIEVKKTGKKG